MGYFIKKAVPFLKLFKKSLGEYRNTKASVISNNKLMMTIINKYEELNVSYYTGSDPEKQIFTNPNNQAIKEAQDEFQSNLKNSFDELYHWCKSEIYDLQSIEHAIMQRDNIEHQRVKLEGKKKTAETDLGNV